ncbi:hypothetical protein D6783_04910 [Candidatus Woesearchaeota archaeon]|nr:MAG: hypothetical protein D6783_04910 [Candidatus Woesearchaeota archaeon]
MQMMMYRPFFPFGIVFQLGILLAFLAILWWLLKGGGGREESARAVLDRRLAAGEISKKEYKELRKLIEDGEGGK